MTGHSIKADHISAGYGNEQILDSVHMHIPENKITVILGSNGSGKSTMLKTFCRLLTPTSGQILLDDKPLSSLKTKAIARTSDSFHRIPWHRKASQYRNLFPAVAFPTGNSWLLYPKKTMRRSQKPWRQ